MIDQVKKRIIELEGQPEVDEEGLGDDDAGSDMEGSREREGDALDETEARLQVCILVLNSIRRTKGPHQKRDGALCGE